MSVVIARPDSEVDLFREHDPVDLYRGSLDDGSHIRLARRLDQVARFVPRQEDRVQIAHRGSLARQLQSAGGKPLGGDRQGLGARSGLVEL